jgi:hypothetical protein
MPAMPAPITTTSASGRCGEGAQPVKSAAATSA